MSKFQFITIGIFVVCIIAGVIAFATYKGSSGSSQLAPITIWGVLPASAFEDYVAQINNGLSQPLAITYVEKSEASFSSDFIAALARGNGPDAILIPSDLILQHEDKLALIPYTALSQREFLDTYISEASIYISANGILAIPVVLDPLVMYWNRDLFNAAGVATYPRFWDEFSTLVPKLTAKDANGNIRQSAVALGDFTTVDNAREILGSLFLQLGNPVTQPTQGGFVTTSLTTDAAADPTPALQFFTQFVDPTNASYSWNRGLPDSKTAFLSGTLATYFGFASELKDIREKNPNIDFDVAPLPQVRNGGTKASYGRLYGLSIVRASPNVNAAYQTIATLTSAPYLKTLTDALYLPNVRRDVIASGSSDPSISIFNDAALISKTWLDAGPDASRQIFASMVESITSGQKSIPRALQDESGQYDVVLKQAMQ